MNILVVDDDDIQADLAVMTIEECAAAKDATVHVAHSFQEAVEVGKALDQLLVLSDLQLGDGLGTDLAKHLPDAVIHVMTCSPHPMEGSIAKPLDLDEQIQLFEDLIHSARPTILR